MQWDTGTVNSYRMGKEDKYDLDLAPSELLPKTGVEESKEEPEDSKLTTGGRVQRVRARVLLHSLALLCVNKHWGVEPG